MARKVFLSFLGTGGYESCRYAAELGEGKFSYETKYIQEATLQYLLQIEGWSENDVAYIFLSPKAKSTHWENSEKEGQMHSGLKECLERCSLPMRIVSKEGIPNTIKDERQIEEVFMLMYECLEQEDELYIDITHAFRYMPMLLFVLSHYAKILKKCKIKSITYGQFEGFRDAPEKPIIDLTYYSTLFDWTYAAGQYVDSGNVDKIEELCREQWRVIRPQLNREELQQQNIQDFATALQKVVSERKTCRGRDIIESRSLKKAFDKGENLKYGSEKPFVPIFEALLESLKDEFSQSKDIDNMKAAVKWCMDKGLYQQAITMLQEYVITYICSVNLFDEDNENKSYLDKKKRELVSSALNIKIQNKKESEWRVSSPLDFAKIRTLLEKDALLNNSSFCDAYADLQEKRNSVNHAAMNDKVFEQDRIKSAIEKVYALLKQLIAEKREVVKHEIARSSNKLLVNLSNHPYEQWSERQKAEEIKEWGEVVDMAFPNIDPKAGEEEIEKLCEEYEQKIMEYAAERDVTVHVMGEMTFTFQMVERMKRKGIDCVASTTERLVTQKEEVIEKRFEFARFRKY